MSLVQFRPEAYADLAHLVERNLAKVEVAGPSPVIRLETVMTASRLFSFSPLPVRGDFCFRAKKKPHIAMHVRRG